MDGKVSMSGMARQASPRVRLMAMAMGLAALAGCATVPPPPPPPPPAPPPVVQLIPQRPYPPMGAAPIMTIPAVGLDGRRLTINRELTAAQTTWNLRSALNVAALNCLSERHVGILPNYKIFLTKFERPLRTTSGVILSEFRERYGRAEGQPQFDNYMTQVYNYFALPPALPRFCDAAQTVSAEATLVAPADLDSFAARSLPVLEAVFEDFFRSYEGYQRSLANWIATYGADAIPGMPVPAWVRTGSLGSTTGEQVLYRETPQGASYTDTVGTVEVVSVPQETAAPSPSVALPPAGDLPPAPVTVVDPGASASVPPSGVVFRDPYMTPDATTAPPAPASGAIVFESNPVVQTEPPKDD